MRKIALIGIFLITISVCTAQKDIIYDDVGIMCLNLSGLSRGLIISTSDEYKELLKNLSPHPECTSYSLPEIDFNSKTLLGLRVNSKGCSAPEYFRRIYMVNGEVVFNVDIKENGMCKMLHQVTYWVTIPKEFGEKVQFITNMK